MRWRGMVAWGADRQVATSIAEALEGLAEEIIGGRSDGVADGCHRQVALFDAPATGYLVA